MTLRFDPGGGLIVVPSEITGPSGTAILRLALDTGATFTLVNTGMLVALGYDPASAEGRMQVTTGSGVEYAPRVEVRRIRALGARARAGQCRERAAIVLLLAVGTPVRAVAGVLQCRRLLQGGRELLLRGGERVGGCVGWGSTLLGGDQVRAEQREHDGA